MKRYEHRTTRQELLTHVEQDRAEREELEHTMDREFGSPRERLLASDKPMPLLPRRMETVPVDLKAPDDSGAWRVLTCSVTHYPGGSAVALVVWERETETEGETTLEDVKDSIDALTTNVSEAIEVAAEDLTKAVDQLTRSVDAVSSRADRS
jgi:predicted  nucleic acid-binding Zn-ribbon protein